MKTCQLHKTFNLYSGFWGSRGVGEEGVGITLTLPLGFTSRSGATYLVFITKFRGKVDTSLCIHEVVKNWNEKLHFFFFFLNLFDLVNEHPSPGHLLANKKET